jgi:hypothetical protein
MSDLAEAIISERCGLAVMLSQVATARETDECQRRADMEEMY